MENNTTGKTATTRVVNAVQVLLSFAAALLEKKDQLQATSRRKGTELLPSTKMMFLIDETTKTNPGDKVRPWDEQRVIF